MHRAAALRSALEVRDQVLRTRDVPDSGDVRDVLLILSASRGGSSLLYEVLADSPDFLALCGEHVPFYKLHGLDAADSADGSDQLTGAAPERVRALGATLMSEVRVGGRHVGPEDTGFASMTALRLVLQWPQLADIPGGLVACVEGTLARARPDGTIAGAERALVDVASALADLGHRLDLRYYDAAFAAGGPGPRAAGSDRQGPPHEEICLEEPPFVVPRPRRLPDAAEVRTKPLLLKAPLDAYRLPVLRALFPRAHFAVVHLTRDPAASVNGLCDGWLDRGFFSHRVASGLGADRLAIGGYSRPGHWSSEWWNFDLPPGWRERTEEPLAEVCAFQWASVHRHILAGCEDPDFASVLRVRFEDLIGPPERRARAVTAIRDFAGVDHPGRHAAAAGPLPLVMTTAPPVPGRWLARRDLILPAITRPEVAELADHLGYPVERDHR